MNELPTALESLRRLFACEHETMRDSGTGTMKRCTQMLQYELMFGMAHEFCAERNIVAVVTALKTNGAAFDWSSAASMTKWFRGDDHAETRRRITTHHDQIVRGVRSWVTAYKADSLSSILEWTSL